MSDLKKYNEEFDSKIRTNREKEYNTKPFFISIIIVWIMWLITIFIYAKLS